MLPINAVVIPVTPFRQNTSLVWCTATMKGAFVDPGGEVEKLVAVAAERGVTIEKIMLTHGHLDHAGAAAALSEKYGVPIEGPHRDEDWLRQGIAEAGARYGMTDARACTLDRWLEDGDVVTLGDVAFDVYHCPGHTPGHVIFHHAPSQVAMVGDVLFQGSIGRTDFPMGNHQDLLDAIVTRLWPLGGATNFVPGHGPMSTFAHERATNPYVADRVLSIS